MLKFDCNSVAILLQQNATKNATFATKRNGFATKMQHFCNTLQHFCNTLQHFCNTFATLLQQQVRVQKR
jgi:hypothetical protein